MKSQSNWRSVRAAKSQLAQRLRTHHSLRLHGVVIGSLVLGSMWALSHMEMVLGVHSLALRYLLTLGFGYAVFLGMLRAWASVLLRSEAVTGDDALSSLDGVVTLPDFAGGSGGGVPALGDIAAGGGGDFAGAGASADFSVADGPGDAVGELASDAIGAVAGSDDGAAVVVPVVAVFLMGLAIVFGVGSLLLLYFGWNALLTVAVEVAFSYTSAHTAVRVVSEGWLSAAIRLTWKPLLGALVCAVLLGATIDHFVPSAQSLPHAVHLIRSGHVR